VYYKLKGGENPYQLPTLSPRDSGGIPPFRCGPYE